MSHREVVPDGDDRRLARRVCLVLIMIPGKEEEEKKEQQQTFCYWLVGRGAVLGGRLLAALKHLADISPPPQPPT